MGNLRSVAKALEAAGSDVEVTSKGSDVAGAAALCVPGQGIFGRCVDNLAARGLEEVVRSWIGADKPYLGICLGMQILFEHSEEAGTSKGLGILSGRVTKLPDTVTVPHMGWNTVGDTYFYFDHSFAVHPADEGTVTGWCEHGERFAARVETGSILGVQFHPEKSGSSGIELLKGWLGSF
ncbi:MAG: imidazole glycerol-phosphate synthase subunit HisH [Actinomycetota bacterium]|jgi:glutamine amidotransferase|nr:imidazole glycerol-phosphate synthase subunit HisH [Actinomycetota bacterium]